MNSYRLFVSAGVSILCFLYSTSTIYADRNTNLKMDENGNIVSIWVDPVENTIKGCVCYNNSKEPIRTLSRTNDPRNPNFDTSATHDNDIQGAIIWTEINPKTSNLSLYGRILLPYTHVWTDIVQISTNSENVQDNYFVRVNTKGNICATWNSCQLDSSCADIRCSTSEVDASNIWSAPMTLSIPK